MNLRRTTLLFVATEGLVRLATMRKRESVMLREKLKTKTIEPGSPLHEQLIKCVEALERAQIAMDKLYRHNESVRHAVIEHYGLHHSQAIAGLEKELE